MKKAIEKGSGAAFSHWKLLLTWPVYFGLYLLTENLIPAECCTPIHIFLDDWIPFCEWFVIPYVFWYGWIAYSLAYFLFRDAISFRRLQIYLFTVQLLAVTVHILFPSRQDLRPEIFTRDNILIRSIRLLYRLDTNTGVFPSLHVACSFGVMSTWLHRKSTSPWGRAFVVVTGALICLSTMFIKQHSAADFFAALPVCLVAEFVSHCFAAKPG